jgi:hypothetical protein
MFAASTSRAHDDLLPHDPESFCARSRATKSDEPPAEYGTMHRTGLEGYSCASVAERTLNKTMKQAAMRAVRMAMRMLR